MRICFDMDGVIATLVSDGDYSRAQPIQETIDLIWNLHNQGHTIIISTARGFISGKDWTEVTERQLYEWGVLYDVLNTSKVGADYYVDDRAVPLDFLEEYVLKEKGNEKDKNTSE